MDIYTLYTRVMARTAPDGDCLLCTYSVGSHGYAQVGWAGKQGRGMLLAHRVVWEWTRGPIPEGMVIDHLCHVKRCVNVEHLRVTTNPINASDNGMLAFRRNVEVGRECKLGHPLVAAAGGKAYCRDCKARRKRERRAAKAF